jgi:hypothetical protein
MSPALAVKNKEKTKKEMPNSSNGSKRKATKAKKARNLLKLTPVRNCKWTTQKKNPIRILKPRFDTKIGKKLGNRLKLKPTFNINLDEYGTAVWRLCDGKLTVEEIGEILKTQFAQDVEPLYPRLAAFLRILEANEVLKIGAKKRK